VAGAPEMACPEAGAATTIAAVAISPTRTPRSTSIQIPLDFLSTGLCYICSVLHL
jgi:hypothetical protein